MMRVVFAAEAEDQLAARKRWWRQHRSSAPDLLDSELAAAVLLLEANPNLLPVFSTVRGREIRRCLLPKTRCHLYFHLDEAAGAVTVLSAWGAQRGKEPPLR